MDGFRHEEKFFISTASARMLQGRLRAALGRDGHAGEDGRYFIRSLYFDDYQQSGLFDKIEGVENGRNTAYAFTIWTTATSASSSSRSSAP